MFKRFWWLFLVILAVGAMVWLAFPRTQPKKNGTGMLSSQQTSAAAPVTRNSEVTGGESDQDVARESTRHSTGEVEKYQAEERPLVQMKQAISDQEERVEEKRKVLADIVRTKGIIYMGSDASFLDKAGAAEPVEKQEEPSSPDQAKEAARRTLDAQDYVDAKRDFETDQRLLEEMKLRLANERAKSPRDGK